jgi:hypothetical protein
LYLFKIVLRIGFIDAPYTIQEVSGFVTVSVGLIGVGLELDSDFVVTLATNDRATIQNAAQGNRRMSILYCSITDAYYTTILISGGVDYESLTVDLTFSSIVKRIDMNVTILDDSIVELTEVFEGQLHVTAVTVGPNVILNPRRADISILDDPQDSKSIPMQASMIPLIFFID